MNSIRILFGAVTAVVLAGCAGVPQSQRSYADPSLSGETTQYLAQDMAERTSTILSPSKTQLVIGPTVQSQAAHGAIVADAFRKKGYAVREASPQEPGKPTTPAKGVAMRYQITADSSMILSRVDLPRNSLTRGYGYRDDTSLAATGPWSNLELAQ